MAKISSLVRRGALLRRDIFVARGPCLQLASGEVGPRLAALVEYVSLSLESSSFSCRIWRVLTTLSTT